VYLYNRQQVFAEGAELTYTFFLTYSPF